MLLFTVVDSFQVVSPFFILLNLVKDPESAVWVIPMENLASTHVGVPVPFYRTDEGRPETPSFFGGLLGFGFRKSGR
jgi:hypothetical protein